MSHDIFVIDHPEGIDNNKLVAEIVEAVRRKESITLVARRMGLFAVDSVFITDKTESHYISETAQDDDATAMEIEFAPEDIHIGLAKGPVRNDLDVAQVATGKALNRITYLTIPVDSNYPPELEVRDPKEKL
jgi:hypothetical protein